MDGAIAAAVTAATALAAAAAAAQAEKEGDSQSAASTGGLSECGSATVEAQRTCGADADAAVEWSAAADDQCTVTLVDER